jgi:CheY-like chemotaxis protein
MYTEFNRLAHDSPWGEKGLGLGLSICERLAKLMQHRLSFSSHPGRGSTFGVRVSCEKSAGVARSIAPRLPAPDPGNLQGMRVLCVDNDGAILDGMKALLGQWGVHVLKARNCAEATALCGQNDVDTVLADYHLDDGVNGIELLHRLCKSRPSKLPAALISADHDAHLALAARHAGFPLLHKPLRPAALRALLGAFRLEAQRASAA